MASCVIDQVTNLPVCDILDEDRVALHEALAVVSDYLLEHHMADTAPYHYRRTYLPGRITGNDVVALSRLGQEMGARHMTIPSEFTPFLPTTTGSAREYVKPEQIENVADNADKIEERVRAALEAIKVWDAQHRRGGGARWIFAAAVGAIAAVGAAAVMRSK